MIKTLLFIFENLSQRISEPSLLNQTAGAITIAPLVGLQRKTGQGKRSLTFGALDSKYHNFKIFYYYFIYRK